MSGFQLYEPRQPRRSPLWRCVCDHAQAFLANYDRQHQSRLGPLRSIVAEVLEQWKHSGFNLFRGEAIPGGHRAELESLVQ